VLDGITRQRFEKVSTGAVVRAVERAGKWVVLALTHGSIVIQPRMTGGFWLVEPDRPEHIRLWFDLAGSSRRVWFCDTRCLGRVSYYVSPDSFQAALQKSHGPDALQVESEYLAERFRRTRRPIKAVLMDQQVLAGIGNIYADEILFLARVHPAIPAASLSRERSYAIHSAIRPVLDLAIEAEGASFDAAYRTVLGREGGFLKRNAVHRRQNQPCLRCGSPIRKTRILGLSTRPTYFCGRCQRQPR
jgi:formamidopyrimidine-DNA glycosylase